MLSYNIMQVTCDLLAISSNLWSIGHQIYLDGGAQRAPPRSRKGPHTMCLSRSMVHSIVIILFDYTAHLI